MKVRHDFVTNSSSSSYTIVLRDNTPEGYFSLFDLLKIAFSRVNLEAVDEHGAIYFEKHKVGTQYDDRSFKILDVKGFIASSKSNIEWEEENIPDEEAQIAKYEDLLKQPEDIIACFADAWDLKQGGSRLESARRKLNQSLQYHKNNLESAKKKLEFNKKQLRVLEEFAGNEWDDLILLFVDVDDWSRKNIEGLIEKSGAIVLKKERT